MPRVCVCVGALGCQKRLDLGGGREGRVAAFFGVGSGFSSGFGLGLGTAASPCPRGRRREGRGITGKRRGALPTERMRWGRGCPKHRDPRLERGSGTPTGWLRPALGPRAAQLPRDLPDPPPPRRGQEAAGRKHGWKAAGRSRLSARFHGNGTNTLLSGRPRGQSGARSPAGNPKAKSNSLGARFAFRFLANGRPRPQGKAARAL